MGAERLQAICRRRAPGGGEIFLAPQNFLQSRGDSSILDRWAGVPVSRHRIAGAFRPHCSKHYKETRVPLYEHVFIARPDLSAQQAEGLTATYGEILRAEGGRVDGTEYWGLRNLAYRIKRYRKGHYSMMKIEAPHQAVAEMERRMRLSNEVVRFLTVGVEALSDQPSPILQALNERSYRREEAKEGSEAKGEEAAADAPDDAADAPAEAASADAESAEAQTAEVAEAGVSGETGESTETAEAAPDSPQAEPEKTTERKGEDS